MKDEKANKLEGLDEELEGYEIQFEISCACHFDPNPMRKELIKGLYHGNAKKKKEDREELE